MKLSILSGFALLALYATTFTSCTSDVPKLELETPPGAKLEYTSQNAAGWNNYMVQVAALIRHDSNTLYDAWTKSYQGGKSFAENFKLHEGGDYPSALSCIVQIIEGCADIANEVGTAKIGDPYQLYLSGDITGALYAVESWYSWHSREDYSNNILSIRNSYFGSTDGTVNPNSISAIIAAENPELDNNVKEAISNAYDSIIAIPQPFRNHISSPESRIAMTACANLEILLSNNVKSAVNALKNDSRFEPAINQFVDGVVIPTYKSLMERNDNLYQAVLSFKQNPTDRQFANCCRAWLKAREPWETSEAFLFGPVDALGLDPNMDSWPLDQDNIVQILTSGKYDNLNWTDGDDDATIEAVQSVRGYHTLEYLLFKDGQPRTIKK